MPTTRFVDLDTKNLAFQALRSNDGGKGKTAYINVKNGDNAFQCVRARMPFALKPGMGETVVKDFMKMKLVMTLDPAVADDAATIAKLKEVDEATVAFIWDKRSLIYPPEKLKFMTDKNASLMPSFNPLIKDGKIRDDGTSYNPSFTVQVPNLACLVDHLVIEKKEKDGKTEDICKDVVWKNMLVNDYKPADKQPTMYLCYGKNDSGQDIISKTTPMRRPDGTVLTDSAGQVVKRWVGPQDMVPGSLVRAVFKFSKVYVVAGFGTHLELVAVIIEPPAPRASADIDGAVEVDNYDPLLAARVLSAIVPSTTEDHPSPQSEELRASDIPAPAMDSPAKRKNDDAPGAPPRKKAKKSDE